MSVQKKRRALRLNWGHQNFESFERQNFIRLLTKHFHKSTSHKFVKWDYNSRLETPKLHNNTICKVDSVLFSGVYRHSICNQPFWKIRQSHMQISLWFLHLKSLDFLRQQTSQLAPVDLVDIPVFIGFCTSQVVGLGISEPSTVPPHVFPWNSVQVDNWNLGYPKWRHIWKEIPLKYLC